MTLLRAPWVGIATCLVAVTAGCVARAEDPPLLEAAPATSAAAPDSRVTIAQAGDVLTARASAPPPVPTSAATVVSEPAAVVTLPIQGDLPASLVRGRNGGGPRTVFLPGLCSNANAYLQAFPEAAQAVGGVVAIDGEKACAPGFRSFVRDANRQNARIEAALTQAGLTAFPPEGVTLIGYSQGASIAEDLVERWPERYSRVVLMGSPKDPAAQRLKAARAAATMSCSLDVPGRMRDGAKRIAATGVPAAYFEMPGCTHGNIADGERVFADVFAWLAAH